MPHPTRRSQIVVPCAQDGQKVPLNLNYPLPMPDLLVLHRVAKMHNGG